MCTNNVVVVWSNVYILVQYMRSFCDLVSDVVKVFAIVSRSESANNDQNSYQHKHIHGLTLPV